MSKGQIHKLDKYNLFLPALKAGTIIKQNWLNDFLHELNSLYENNFVVAGSSAVILYLNYFNELTNGKFNSLVSTTKIPNDIDFLYYCKGTNYESRRTINNFSRLQDYPQRSVTFMSDPDKNIFSIIKSFDLTSLSAISYVTIDKYKILTLDKLFNFYLNDLKENEMILEHNKEELLELEKNIEEFKKKRKIDTFLKLQSEYEILELSTDKIKNKLLAIENKINIINVLNKNIEIEPSLKSSYSINYILEKKYFEDNAINTNLFAHNLIQKLFSSDSGYESDNEERELEDSTKTQKTQKTQKLMLPMLLSPNPSPSKPDDFNTEKNTITDIKSESGESVIKYTYVPYKIKFDFEDDV